MSTLSSDLRLDLPDAPTDLQQVVRRLAAAAEGADAVAVALAEGAMELLRAEGCLVARSAGRALVVDGAAGSLGVLAQHELQLAQDVATALRERGTVTHRARDGALPLVSPLLAGTEIRQLIAAPLTESGTPFGVLAVINRVEGVFAEGDATLLHNVAELGSMAFRTSRLLERERLRTKESRALAEIVQHLNQSLELERVVTLIAEHACDLLGGEGATVMMLEEGERLRFAGTAGHARERFRGHLPLDAAFSGEAIRRKATARTTDLRLDPRWAHSARLIEGVAQNAVVAPLLVADRAIGTVFVYGNARREFDDHDEELLKALAMHAAVAIENARLYRAAARTARHAEILSAAGRTLATHAAPGTIFDGIWRVARQLLGADGFTVYAVDPERRVASVSHTHGAGSAYSEDASINLFGQRSGRAIEAREEVVIEDVRLLDDDDLSPALRANKAAGVVAWAFIPLIVESTVRGLLTIRWHTRRTFDEGERDMLRDFGTQVALVMRNARLLGDLERRAARLAAVAKVQQAIPRTELNEVYGEIYRAARSSVPRASVFAISLTDAGRELLIPQLVVVDGVSTRASALTPVPRTDCAASRALAAARPVLSDVPRLTWSAFVTGNAARRPLRSEIAVPILHGEEARGVLVAQSVDEGAFDADDADILALIARQAGAAIENARLFEAERHARAIAEAAAAIARAALGSVSTSRTAGEILDAVDRVIPSAGKALGLATDGGETLTYVAATEALRALGGLSVPQRESAVRLIAGTDAVTPAAEALATIREGSVAAPGVSILPLIAKNRVLGVLWTLPVAGMRAREGETEALGRLATHVALAADVLLLGEEERKRRERERMLATALATMDQPVFVLGLDRRVWYANAAAVREYRFSPNELTEIAFDSLVASAVPARRMGTNIPANSSSVWMAEHVHQRRDGSQFPASVMISYIRDDAGAPVGQVLNVRNLTDERRIEEQLRQSEKLAALGELVAGVAHELNNPLAGISAFAQLLLEEEELAGEQRESVRLIKREADRAVSVIRDLLIFSRKAGPTRAPVDINEIIELTLRLRSYSLRTAGIEVKSDLDVSLDTVEGDDQRLQQVFLNLIVNAEYALQRSTTRRITLKSEASGEGLVVTVADTGEGMTEETRQRIFEPFFTTKPAGQGTGLGLSVSYGIVQGHGGSISVESERGIGTVFRVYLPARGDAQRALSSAS